MRMRCRIHRRRLFDSTLLILRSTAMDCPWRSERFSRTSLQTIIFGVTVVMV